jgi:Right handed beta helix region
VNRFLLFLLFPTALAAAVWTDSNSVPRVPGTDVGVPGGIPDTSAWTVTNVTGLTAGGSVDNTAAIQGFINAAGTNTVLLLPAGTYRVNSRLNIQKSNLVLRGAGTGEYGDAATTTLLSYCDGGQILFVGSASDYDWNYPNSGGTAISGSPAKGATSITVSSATNFAIGKIIRIWLDNDLTLPVVHVSGYNGLRKQTTRITGINGNVLSIFPTLYFALPSGLNPKVSMARDSSFHVGVENLKIDNTNGSGGSGYTFWGEQCYGCWIKNVTSYMCVGYHLFIQDSLQCEIRHCHVVESQTHVNNGSGIILYSSSGNLVEDNILEKVFPGVEVNKGSSGNVFGYNLAVDNYYGSPPDNAGESFGANHDAHNSYDLYEGNVGECFQTDAYFGSVSEMTAFRNWFRGYCPDTPNNWKCVDLGRFTRNTQIVGNILGQTGYTWTIDIGTTDYYSYSVHIIYRMGYPNMGNTGYSGFANTVQGANDWADWNGGYPTVGAGGLQELDLDVRRTTTLLGNYDVQTAGVPSAQALGSTTLPNSLYLTGKPTWFGGLTWPAFSPSSPNMSLIAIPAGYRYINGQDPPADSDTTPPTVTAATIPTGGTTLVLTTSEPCTIGAGGGAGLTVTMSGGAATVGSVSGTNTSSFTATLSRPIGANETGTFSYAQPGAGITDMAGNELASISNATVINNQTVITISGANVTRLWLRRRLT